MSTQTSSSSAMPAEQPPSYDLPADGSVPVIPGMPAGLEAASDSARMEWMWSEYEKQMEEMKAYQEEGMDIYPTPGLVLKTILVKPPTRLSPQFPILTPGQLPQGRCKFFINLCSDPAIEMPSMIQDQQGNEQLRVPISVGPVSLDVEKDGVTSCLVCDVVFNPDSLQKVQKEKEFRTFLSSFAMQKLEDKYQIELDGGQMSWPVMRYKGPPGARPPAQHIRRPKGAHVEEEKDEPEMDEEEKIEERRKAAALARMQALREMEERESGISMSKDRSNAASSGDIFTSEQQAAAAASSTTGRSSVKKESAKIEVISNDASPTPARSTTTSKPSTSSAKSTPSSTSSSATASLPEHTITYLKTIDSEIGVPYSEWDMDLPTLPAAIRVTIILPLVDKSSTEMEVEINRIGVTIQSKSDFKDKHSYQLHMQFPFLLDEETSQCKFTKKNRTMTLILPVTGRREIEEEIIPEPTSSKPVVDYQDELGLTNTLMFRLVSIE